MRQRDCSSSRLNNPRQSKHTPARAPCNKDGIYAYHNESCFLAPSGLASQNTHNFSQDQPAGAGSWRLAA